MSSILKQLAIFLTNEYATDISRYDERFLLSVIQNRIDNTPAITEEEYLTHISKTPEEACYLLDSLQINHSEFFRNSITYATLDRLILPPLIERKKRSRQTARVWSAACARGEEPYSIAILFEEHNRDVNPKVKYRIFATDHNESVIEEAQKGEFSEASVGNLKYKDLTRWFTEGKGKHTVIPELRTNIEFSLFDLLGNNHNSPPASIYGDFDIIVCANLLFYYGEEARKKIVNRLTSSLAPGGYLITGEAERELIKKFRFREIYPQSAIFTLY